MHEIASKIDLHENLEEQNCESASNKEGTDRRSAKIIVLLGYCIFLFSVERRTLVSSIARISAFLSLLFLFFSLNCSRVTIVCIGSAVVGVASCVRVLVLRLTSATILSQSVIEIFLLTSTV